MRTVRRSQSENASGKPKLEPMTTPASKVLPSPTVKSSKPNQVTETPETKPPRQA
jgi:hypothetical protein